MKNQHRSGIRIPVELPVFVEWKGPTGGAKKATGKTGNVSGNGLFISVATRLRRNTPISFTVPLPSDVAPAPLELLCQGRVVRWSDEGETAGVGVIIDEYELRPIPNHKKSNRSRKKRGPA
jgi:PilZ domain